MPNPFSLQGASLDQSHFAPLLQNRIFTGIWTNRSALRDAATTFVEERYYGGRQDSIIDGLNSEVSSRLTLIRRWGTSIYNSQTFPQINRFYSFNTFTINSEVIRVMADTSATVYDATSNSTTPNTKTAIWQKSAGAVGNPTFFLGVGNMLYMTNGVDNKQWAYNPATGAGPVWNWGIVAPVLAPNVSQQPKPNPYPAWAQTTGHAPWVAMADGVHFYNYICIVDTNNNLQVWGYQLNNAPPLLQVKTATLGTSAALPWATAVGGLTQDGTMQWQNVGTKAWASGFGYAAGQVVVGSIANPAGTPDQMFVAIHGGNANISGTPPFWPLGLGQQVSDGTNGLIWQNIGPALHWTDIGSTTVSIGITTQPHIVDPNGYLQTVNQQGRTAASPPSTWIQQVGALTTDGNMSWVNAGPYAVPGTAPIQYGYAYRNDQSGGISNMSPASLPITVIQGNQVTVQGVGSADSQVSTIYIYRTAQGGSTFVYLTQIANPGAVPWTYLDSSPDTALNPTIIAAINGEMTPPPAGATCMAYHLQRIFVAVGNVVYFSTGPDGVLQGSSGDSGFQPTNSFTCQSRITRFWSNSVGLVVFTVRDAYIILLDQSAGGASQASSLFIMPLIDGVPLLHYDAFTVNKSVAYLMTGQSVVVSLEASSGILEISFPIADQIALYDPKASFVTWHSESSAETALYVSNGQGEWFRWAATTAPESGFNWSPRAQITNLASAVQSVEVLPGQNRLLIGPGPAGGPIGFRDRTTSADNGTAYASWATFGSIVVAAPGQLGGLAFITLESARIGTATALSVLLGEIHGKFESIPRSRQDPPNLPPSTSLYSDRFSLLQSQRPVWCRHFQMRLDWPVENAANELFGFTIFGQTWQEYRSQ